jgi:hypothetical protein
MSDLAARLQNPRFVNLTDAELRYIIKDANEAASCMFGHNPVAEAKYLDQVNDACTVLNARRFAR